MCVCRGSIPICPQITQCQCPPIWTGIKLDCLETTKTEMSGGSLPFFFNIVLVQKIKKEKYKEETKSFAQ